MTRTPALKWLLTPMPKPAPAVSPRHIASRPPREEKTDDSGIANLASVDANKRVVIISGIHVRAEYGNFQRLALKQTFRRVGRGADSLGSLAGRGTSSPRRVGCFTWSGMRGATSNRRRGPYSLDQGD